MIRKFSIRLHEVDEDELTRVYVPTISRKVSIGVEIPKVVIKDMLITEFKRLIEEWYDATN